MADKTTESNTTASTAVKTERDHAAVKEDEMKNALLYPFFISALKDIHKAESPNWQPGETTEASINFDEDKED
ncbi:hypothetical protein DBR39_05990 [Chryseobacterium sp. KBW03]|jgi:hypothetical protein|uniref:hypothetical protein n=1 Tax=Chryseobacterium sp. KBW03 TaxID=2153362 RepID=UPI000F594780|nr:hypothetical protein [Chryseobacterium sp. KBW03]RQO40494.1 hypothetical protein DBR39_05990 [Chryseobacterium sp. KBW03]